MVARRAETVGYSAVVVHSPLQRRDPDRQVRFSIQDDVWATADRALIRSVLQNLTENAWKFTGRRSEAVIEFGATPLTEGRRVSE